MAFSHYGTAFLESEAILAAQAVREGSETTETVFAILRKMTPAERERLADACEWLAGHTRDIGVQP